MSKASQIIVLCEDKLQDVFVRRFLKHGWGKGPRDVRVVRCPQSGSGEKHVRDKYPDQLRAYRTRSARAGTILIAVIDADDGTVQDHHQELDRACGCAQPRIDARKDNEAVVHVIPRWHIETWLAYLDDVSVTEDRQYKPKYAFRGCESKCHPLVDKLAAACKSGTLLEDIPESLIKACKEFERIKALL